MAKMMPEQQSQMQEQMFMQLQSQGYNVARNDTPSQMQLQPKSYFEELQAKQI